MTLPPLADLHPWQRTVHGVTWTDNYEWLRDKEDARVTAYLDAENAYTDEATAHLADLRQQIFDEIKGRTQETDLSVPVRRGNFWYYSRTFEGRQYGMSCRAPISTADDWTPPEPHVGPADEPALPGEQVLLDLDALADGHEFFALGGSSVSPDESLLVYGTDTVGDERYTLRVKRLSDHTLFDDVITDSRGSGVWHPDGEHFYYTTVDAAWRSDKVWCHRLGTAQSEDVLIHHETDERFFTGIGKTRSGRFLLVGSGSKITTDYLIHDTERPELGWWSLCERREGLEYNLDHAVVAGRDVWVIVHNLRAADFEVSLCEPTPTAPEDWTPWLEPAPGVTYAGAAAFARNVVVSQRSGGLTQLRVIELNESGFGDDTLIDFPSETYTVGLGANPDFAQPLVRIGYTTLATPSSVFEWDPRTRELILRKQSVVLGDYTAEDYVEHRLWATARDGVRVPISLVVRRNVTGPVPLHLYAYGAYEIPVDPYFSVARLSVLDRGAAFAIAHVRGGGELGREWYETGKFGFKQNTFSDFIDCARHLVAEGWTTPELTVGEGGSAGGLLIGAVANQAPHDFGALVADVAFVDTLTTMLDPSLPLTVPEYDEWGNPTDDPEAFATIRAYSPYDNVTTQAYPAILAETSLNDTRVLFVEPAKWVAKLRALNNGAPQVLLRTEMSAGHGGVSGRYEMWRQRAFSLAWMLDQMGLADQ